MKKRMIGLCVVMMIMLVGMVSALSWSDLFGTAFIQPASSIKSTSNCAWSGSSCICSYVTISGTSSRGEVPGEYCVTQTTTPTSQVSEGFNTWKANDGVCSKGEPITSTDCASESKTVSEYVEQQKVALSYKQPEPTFLTVDYAYVQDKIFNNPAPMDQLVKQITYHSPTATTTEKVETKLAWLGLVYVIGGIIILFFIGRYIWRRFR